MFQKDYKEYMNKKRPEASMVEAMMEEEKKSTCSGHVRMFRVAAAVFCGILLLSGGTVAVDAATNGGIQKLLGLKDSIDAGERDAEFVLIEPTEEYPYGGTLETKPAEDGTLITVIKSTDDAPVFTCHFEGGEGYGDFTFACSLKNCETEEDFAEMVYQQFALALKGYKPKASVVGEVIEKLELIKQDIGTGTAMQDGCAMDILIF